MVLLHKHCNRNTSYDLYEVDFMCLLSDGKIVGRKPKEKERVK